tara:strand:- start:804 stop:1112 length:309 start_codon:yes stop_codon:yes gene_type:complete
MGEIDMVGEILAREGYPLVFVDWIDSCEPADNSDLTPYELPEPQRIFQCGFMVQEHEDHIVVAGGMKPALETYDYVIAIPRVAINGIRHLSFMPPASQDDEL